jgi:hypothetical protein
VHTHDLHARGGKTARGASRGSIAFSLGGGPSERPFKHFSEEAFS